jgi:hypothetical protein
MASEPSGLAARLIQSPMFVSEPDGTGPPTICGGLIWAELFPTRQIASGETASLEMAVIPFREGSAQLVLIADEGSMFAVPLRSDASLGWRSGWNDISVQIRPATQDYIVTINGLRGAALPLESDCSSKGGCYSVRGFSLTAYSGDEAWLDSLSIVKDSAEGREVLYERNFDDCFAAQFIHDGAVIIGNPPRRPARPRAPATSRRPAP